MKRIISAFAAAIILLASCTKDAPATTAITLNAVNTTIVANSWHVTYFYDKTFDNTNSFAGYSFVFSASGTVTATKASVTVPGTWTSGNDDSHVKFVLSFVSPSSFIEISEDWHVIERTDTKIRLQHVSGGSGETSFLTFEKN